MDDDDNLEDLLNTIKTTLTKDKGNCQDDDQHFSDIFDDPSISLMFVSATSDTNNQNQNTEDIDENNTDNNVNIESLCAGADDFLRNIMSTAHTQIEDSSTNNLTTDNQPFQTTTTDLIRHQTHSQSRYSMEHINCDKELKILIGLDEAWKKRMRILRKIEKRLVQRNVPRLMIFPDNYIICYISGTLRILLNAPVFCRFIRRLKHISERSIPSLQPNIDNNIQTIRELFCALSYIVQITFDTNGDINDALQAFRDKYRALYPSDNSKFYMNLMDVLRLVADEMNQPKQYAKAFEIQSYVSIDGKDPTLKTECIMHILSTDTDDLTEYINKYYTGTVTQYEDGHIIEQTFSPLPEQLYTTVDKQSKENHNPNTYPAEFITCNKQRYLLNSGVIGHISSPDCNHWIIILRRQDCIYLFNDHQLIDRFHIKYLPTLFQKFHGRVLLYTKVDAIGEHVCVFEDPLAGEDAGKPSDMVYRHHEREKIVKSLPSDTSVTPIILIRHPVLSMFRFYMHSDFNGDHIRGIPMLNDCLEEHPLYIWPRSLFAGRSIQCTLVFKASDGNFYRSHYKFVRNEGSNKIFENPTYFRIEKDDTSTDEWFPLEVTISKPKQDELQANNDDETDEDNDICQLIRYPDGEKIKVDREKLLSFKKDEDNKRPGQKRPANKSQKVTPFMLSQVVDLNTLYLALRPACWPSNEKEYVYDTDYPFYSNPFKPVPSKIKKFQYDYRSNLLKITELTPSQITLSNETDMCTIHLSYLIPEMYKCTGLKDKCIRITIMTGADKDQCIHPVYKIFHEQSRVSSITFLVNEYTSTLTILIVKYTIDMFESNPELRQTLHNLSTDEQTTPTITLDSLQTILTRPDMTGFRIKLELGHLSNDDPILYPKSTVISEKIIDENVNQERQTSPQVLENTAAENNDNVVDDQSSHVKRPFDEEPNVSSDSSTKCPKLTESNIV